MSFIFFFEIRKLKLFQKPSSIFFFPYVHDFSPTICWLCVLKGADFTKTILKKVPIFLNSYGILCD